MINVIIIIILVACVGGACHSIWKNKKKDVNCIGCPCANSCSGECTSKEKYDS